MNVTAGYCEEVLRTLPVGYYLGHQVTMNLDTKGDATFINMENESITVSYKNIADMCKNAPEDIDKESIIRSLFYHEISHAIMTPSPKTLPNEAGFFRSQCGLSPNQAQYIFSIFKDLFNIFEDERIETLLANYYMNVNFKRNVILLNNIDPNVEQYNKDPIKKFFVLVRYRVGPEELVEEVSSIIRTYGNITATGISKKHGKSTNYAGKEIRNTINNYYKHIVNLFLKLNPEVQNNLEQAKSNTEAYSENCTEDESNNPGNGAARAVRTKCDGGAASCEDCTGALTQKEVEQILGQVAQQIDKNPIPVNLGAIKTIAVKSTTNAGAAAVADRLNMVLASAMNKREARSSCSYGYAGQIDPRACMNRNYKWFAKKASGSSDAKRFDKIHFNLFCDNSGSFAASMDTMNGLILTMKKLAEKNHDFSVTIIHCQAGVKVPDQNNPYLDTNGGSQLTKEIFEIYNRAQVPNATNYNLVVFDGEMKALNDYDGKNFAAFNHPNCIVVSDTDNEEYFKKYAPQAKCKFLTGDYAKQFEQVVLEQIERALA